MDSFIIYIWCLNSYVWHVQCHNLTGIVKQLSVAHIPYQKSFFSRQKLLQKVTADQSVEKNWRGFTVQTDTYSRPREHHRRGHSTTVEMRDQKIYCKFVSFLLWGAATSVIPELYDLPKQELKKETLFVMTVWMEEISQDPTPRWRL